MVEQVGGELQVESTRQLQDHRRSKCPRAGFDHQQYQKTRCQRGQEAAVAAQHHVIDDGLHVKRRCDREQL